MPKIRFKDDYNGIDRFARPQKEMQAKKGDKVDVTQEKFEQLRRDFPKLVKLIVVKKDVKQLGDGKSKNERADTD